MNLEDLILSVSNKRKTFYKREDSNPFILKDLVKLKDSNEVYFFDTSVLNSGIHVLEEGIIQINKFNFDQTQDILNNLYGQIKSINQLTRKNKVILTQDISQEVEKGKFIFEKLINSLDRVAFDDFALFDITSKVFIQYESLVSKLYETPDIKPIEKRVGNYYLPRYKKSRESVLRYKKSTGRFDSYSHFKEPSDNDLKLFLSAYLFNQKEDKNSKIITFDSDILVQGLCSTISSRIDDAPKIIYPTCLKNSFLEEFSMFSLSSK